MEIIGWTSFYLETKNDINTNVNDQLAKFDLPVVEELDKSQTSDNHS